MKPQWQLPLCVALALASAVNIAHAEENRNTFTSFEYEEESSTQDNDDFSTNFDDDEAHQQKLDFSGTLTLDKRFMSAGSKVPMVDFYNKARLELKTWPTENLLVVASSEIRFYDLGTTTSSTDLSKPDTQQPYDILPWEVYFKAHDIFAPGIDLTLGKQRIIWGSADKLNHTDNLNPDDFTDIFDWGAKVPSVAALLSYTFESDASIEFVWVPAVKPILTLRSGPNLNGEQDDLAQLIGNTPIVAQSDKIDANSFDLKHSMQAIRYSSTVKDIDMSISVFHGYDDMPVASGVTVSPVTTGVTLDATAAYMEQFIIGVDFAGELSSIGYWAEFAAVLPKGAEMQITAPHPSTGAPFTLQQTVIEDDPYLKYTLGIDYTFSSGHYFNIQLMHGFFTERAHNELNDYILARLEQDYMDDRIKIALGGGGMIGDWDNLDDNNGFIFAPEITYKPYDNIELIAGAYLLGGEGDEGLFSALSDLDQVTFKTVIKF